MLESLLISWVLDKMKDFVLWGFDIENNVLIFVKRTKRNRSRTHENLGGKLFN